MYFFLAFYKSYWKDMEEEIMKLRFEYIENGQ